MHAVSGSSGGAMFVEDAIERKTNSISYKEFVKDEGGEPKKRKLFGRKDAEQDTNQKTGQKSSRTAA